jgi:hypothetical protein
MINLWLVLLSLVCTILSVLFFAAQMRLFTISATLKDIRDELKAARHVQNPVSEADATREKIITRRILDGSLIPTVVGAKQKMKCVKCGAASTLRCTACGGCETCCKCDLEQPGAQSV